MRTTLGWRTPIAMSQDLTHLLGQWPHDRDDETENVRCVLGEDGALKIQVRVRCGVFQWEYEGRPDGTTPYGYASLAEFYRARFEPSPDALVFEGVDPSNFRSREWRRILKRAGIGHRALKDLRARYVEVIEWHQHPDGGGGTVKMMLFEQERLADARPRITTDGSPGGENGAPRGLDWLPE